LRLGPVVLIFGIWTLALAGCASISGRVRELREKIVTRQEPHVRTFAVDRRAAYAAALAALPGLGLQYRRGGPAQGELEAVSAQDLQGVGNRRSQYVLTVRLADTLDGAAEVRVWLEEYIELDPHRASGRATGAPVRDSALYEAFFRALESGLPRSP
jgi:hypothetical protein